MAFFTSFNSSFNFAKIDNLPEGQETVYNPKVYTSTEVPIIGFIHNTDQKFGPIFKDDYKYNPFKMDVMMAELAPRYTKEFTKGMPRVYMALRNELDRLGLSYANLSIVNRFLGKELPDDADGYDFIVVAYRKSYREEQMREFYSLDNLMEDEEWKRKKHVI